MKLFKKRKDNNETKAFRAHRNRPECIYGPPEMLERYRREREKAENKENNTDPDTAPTENDDKEGAE